MAQTELTCQIVKITGEPLTHRQQVRVQFDSGADQTSLEPEDIELVSTARSAADPVPFPGLASDGSETLAECDQCDIYFGFDPDEVYTLPARGQPSSLTV